MEHESSLELDFRVGDRYRIGKKISFINLASDDTEYVYLGNDIESGKEVAIKLERLDSSYPELKNEYEMYKVLAGGAGVGIPSVEWCGIAGDYNALVLNLLGPSLEELFEFCSGKFSLKTVLLLADQMISRIEYLHSRGIVHRGVKPGNFVMGRGESRNLVYVIDFGRSKLYRVPETQDHIPYREHLDFIGSRTWASICAHQGCEQARRDDLESLAYVFIFFLRGSLPWKGMKDRKLALERQMSSSAESICDGLPSEFCTFLNYTKSLRFDDKPDYAYIRNLFRDLFKHEGYKCNCYDWFPKEKRCRDCH